MFAGEEMELFSLDLKVKNVISALVAPNGILIYLFVYFFKTVGQFRQFPPQTNAIGFTVPF